MSLSPDLRGRSANCGCTDHSQSVGGEGTLGVEATLRTRFTRRVSQPPLLCNESVDHPKKSHPISLKNVFFPIRKGRPIPLAAGPADRLIPPGRKQRARGRRKGGVPQLPSEVAKSTSQAQAPRHPGLGLMVMPTCRGAPGTPMQSVRLVRRKRNPEPLFESPLEAKDHS